jgi:hypothetical protein
MKCCRCGDRAALALSDAGFPEDTYKCQVTCYRDSAHDWGFLVEAVDIASRSLLSIYEAKARDWVEMGGGGKAEDHHLDAFIQKRHIPPEGHKFEVNRNCLMAIAGAGGGAVGAAAAPQKVQWSHKRPFHWNDSGLAGQLLYEEPEPKREAAQSQITSSVRNYLDRHHTIARQHDQAIINTVQMPDGEKKTFAWWDKDRRSPAEPRTMQIKFVDRIEHTPPDALLGEMERFIAKASAEIALKSMGMLVGDGGEGTRIAQAKARVEQFEKALKPRIEVTDNGYRLNVPRGTPAGNYTVKVPAKPLSLVASDDPIGGKEADLPRKDAENPDLCEETIEELLIKIREAGHEVPKDAEIPGVQLLELLSEAQLDDAVPLMWALKAVWDQDQAGKVAWLKDRCGPLGGKPIELLKSGKVDRVLAYLDSAKP